MNLPSGHLSFWQFFTSFYFCCIYDGSIIINTLCARWYHCGSIGEPVLNDIPLMCSRDTVDRRTVLTLTVWQCLRIIHFSTNLLGLHTVIDLVS